MTTNFLKSTHVDFLCQSIRCSVASTVWNLTVWNLTAQLASLCELSAQTVAKVIKCLAGTAPRVRRNAFLVSEMSVHTQKQVEPADVCRRRWTCHRIQSHDTDTHADKPADMLWRSMCMQHIHACLPAPFQALDESMQADCEVVSTMFTHHAGAGL